MSNPSDIPASPIKNQEAHEAVSKAYEYGFTTDVHTEIIERGLNEDVVRLISEKKGEPEWLLEFRLRAFRYWQTLEQPSWAHVNLPEIDYQAISYYADPTAKAKDEGKKEIDPELMKTFDKLGIPLEERMALAGVAVDAVMDSVSVKTTFKEKLQEKGVIFCSISEAVRENPELVRKYLGSVVPYRDNYFAALNSAVFSDGSFVYIPRGVRCPMELSTYFRINARNTGQFERTLIVCEDDAYVSYLEGCTAPMRDENQLHAAIVEIVVGANAEVKYSTVQNWYPGDAEGRGGVYNLVTKRGQLRGQNAKLSWTQCHHLEIPLLRAHGRRVASGILQRGRHQQSPRGRHGHQDDSYREEHALDHRLQGYLGGQEPEFLSRPRQSGQQSRRRAQPFLVRQSAHDRHLWRAHLSLHRCAQRKCHGGARSHHEQDFRRPTFLLQPARHPHRNSR